MKNKKVLVTGGLGFIGSNLSKRLLREGNQVTIIDNFLKDCGANMFNIYPYEHDMTIIKHDLNHYDKLDDIVRDQDYIFHLAGNVSHTDSTEYPVQDLEANLLNTIHLLESCKRVNRNAVFLFTSTRQVYGNPKFLPVNEQHDIAPIDINGINKYAAEQYIRFYGQCYGIPTVILRLTNTYGAGLQIRNSKHGIIGWCINRMLTNEPIYLYDGGEVLRDFTHVDDVVDAIIKAARNSVAYGKTYNIGGYVASISDFVKQLVKQYGNCEIKNIEFPKGEKEIALQDYYSSGEKIESDLYWKPQIDIVDGIDMTLSFYKENRKYYLGD